jgi:hypothetical protein
MVCTVGGSMQATITDFAKFRHSSEWQHWATLAADAPPFLAPEFFALTRSFVDTAGVLIATARTEGRLVGVLPLTLEGHTLRGLRSDHSPGYDFVGTHAGIAAIWDCLRTDSRWDELVLDRVPSESLLADELPQLARASGCPVTVRADVSHPYFELPAFEARMKPKFLANLQRCGRKAGDLVFERIVWPTREDLDDATAIEAKAWKAYAGTSIACDPRATHLYASIARLFGQRGRASLAVLRLAGTRIATLFVVEDRHTLYALKIGYDPRYANLSPGHLLVWKVAADAEKRGLRVLDFVGREDDWKRKWTDQVREQKVLVIYRSSARGFIRYGLREVIKPNLPETLRESPRSPLPHRCQRADILGTHSLATRVRGRLSEGLGIKSGIVRGVRGLRRERAPERPRLGAPSKFEIGSWVRVCDEATVRATLDANSRLRGLAFVPSQFRSCDGVFRVSGHVRRLRDDHGRLRAVSGTVILEGVDCGYGSTEAGGCGRHCPLMYRDEWLIPAEQVRRSPPAADPRIHARVRDADEIAAGLDLFGRRDGLTFMPEMARYAGRRFPILDQLAQVYEYDSWVKPKPSVVMLDGLHCSGAICKKDGPCERACTLMWHRDWLIIEADDAS